MEAFTGLLPVRVIFLFAFFISVSFVYVQLSVDNSAVCKVSADHLTIWSEFVPAQSCGCKCQFFSTQNFGDDYAAYIETASLLWPSLSLSLSVCMLVGLRDYYQ